MFEINGNFKEYCFSNTDRLLCNIYELLLKLEAQHQKEIEKETKIIEGSKSLRRKKAAGGDEIQKNTFIENKENPI